MIGTGGRYIGAFPLDTREYGARMRDYRRTINGSFDDDNPGRLNTKVIGGADATIAIDETGKITGKNPH